MAKKGKIGILLAVLFMAMLQTAAGAEEIRGTVMEIDNLRATFRLCPTVEGCPVTEENVFVVRPDTVFKGALSLRDLNVGELVVVEGEPINKIVWKATSVTRP